MNGVSDVEIESTPPPPGIESYRFKGKDDYKCEIFLEVSSRLLKI